MRILTFIAICCFFPVTAAKCPADNERDWQGVLKAELQTYEGADRRIDSVDGVGGCFYIVVPARIAAIYDSHPRANLLSFFDELRRTSGDSAKLVLWGWVQVVSTGARGAVSREDFPMPGLKLRKISVVTYSVPDRAADRQSLTTRSSEPPLRSGR